MANELKDIAERLNGYANDGWVIESAEKRSDGGWNLIIQPMAKEQTQGATNDND